MGTFSPATQFYADARQSQCASLFRHSGSLLFQDNSLGRAQVERAMVGQLKVGRVRSTGHDVTIHSQDEITVLLPLSGTVHCEVRNTDFRAGARETLILSPNPRQTRVEARNGADFVAIPIIFPIRDVQEAIRELGGSFLTRKRLNNFGLTLALDSSLQGRQFFKLAEMLVEDLNPEIPALSKKSAQSWSYLLTEKLVALLNDSDVIELPKGKATGNAYRHVLNAEDFMQEKFAYISTIADIAKACGISVRLLEIAFKAVRGQSPHVVLIRIRLASARQILCDKNRTKTVTQAALDSGFNHLGRFSIAYKQLYGETPSETMRKH